MLNSKNSIYSNGAIVLILAFAFFATPFFINWGSLGHPFLMDINQYYSYLVAGIIDKDIFFNSPSHHSFWLIETPTHHVVPKVTYGLSFFYTPFFIIAKMLSSNQSTGYEPLYAWIIHYGCMIYVIVGLWYLKKILSNWFKDIVVGVSLFLVFFATNLFYYTVSESESVHGILFFLIAFFIYHVLVWQETSSKKSFFLFMLAAGFICLIRPTEILVLLFPLLIGVNSKEKFITKTQTVLKLKWNLILGVIMFLLPIIPQMVFWKIQSGSFLFFSYGSSEGFFWTDPQFINVFFSFKKGFLIYTPIMLFSFIGFVFMYQKNKSVFYPVFFYFLINTYVICCWWDWAYGGSFGLRAFVHCFAILIIPFAYFVEWVLNLYQKSTIKNIMTYMFFLCALFFCFLNVFQSNLYKHRIIHWDGMTKEAYWFTFLKKKYTQQDLTYLKTLIKEPNYEARRKGDRDE